MKNILEHENKQIENKRLQDEHNKKLNNLFSINN